MYSLISSAVLATAAFSQAAFGATIAHSHSRFHAKKEADLLSDAQSALTSLVDAAKILMGQNPTYSQGQAIGLGAGGPFQVEFENQGSEDILLVIWSGYDQASSITAMGVGATPANITYNLCAGASQVVSFDPDNHNGQQISGAFSTLYPGATLSGWGQISDTWGEFTFQTRDTSSTVDVSRLINMNGNNMAIKTYAEQGGDLHCTTDMNTCVFMCADGAATCPAGGIQNCPVGTPYTTSNGWEGGCSGFTQTGGYAHVALSPCA